MDDIIYPGVAREDGALWAFADTLVPIGSTRAVNWAVLNFGAAICTTHQPKCGDFPLKDICCHTINNGFVPPIQDYDDADSK